MLGKRFDDSIFNHFTVVDWRYYEAMIAKDQEEHEQMLMHLAEYVASFMNPSAVAAVTSNREKGTANKKTTDNGSGSQFNSKEEFINMAKKLFS